ncbi:MAG: hypothetical protein JNJ53_05435 [Rhizobiales bacterium]|nr:hypothetical protein [Hyphomicrobiales bacterium]
MAPYTDPRTGEPIPDTLPREPVKPPPGEIIEGLPPPAAYRAGPSTTSILIGVLALVAIVFVFMSMDRAHTPPPPQQTSENVEPAPTPLVPPAPSTPPSPTTVQ